MLSKSKKILPEPSRLRRKNAYGWLKKPLYKATSTNRFSFHFVFFSLYTYKVHKVYNKNIEKIPFENQTNHLFDKTSIKQLQINNRAQKKKPAESFVLRFTYRNRKIENENVNYVFNLWKIMRVNCVHCTESSIEIILHISALPSMNIAGYNLNGAFV